MMKKLLLILSLLLPLSAFAAQQPSYVPSLLFLTTGKYYIGTSSPSVNEASGIFSQDVTISNLGGSGTRCVQTDNNGKLAKASAACGSGGGGTGTGTFATSTSNVAGEFINYPLNATDIVLIGDTSSTTTAPIFFDPNASYIKLFNQYFQTSSTTLQKLTFTTATGTSATTTSLAVSGVVSALHLAGADGSVSAYPGTSACASNNFVTTISSTGGTTCGTGSFTINGTGFNLGDSKTITAASSTLLADTNGWSGTNTFSNVLVGSNNTIQFIGYSALPQLYAGDSTTGLHFDGPGIVSIHNGGIQSVLISSTQKFGIATSSPYAKLSIAGADTSTTLVGVDALTGFSGRLFDLKVASSTKFFVNQAGDTLIMGSTTVQNLTGINATTTNATTTSFFATTASTTNFFGSGLIPCQSGNVLTYDGTGKFGCATDAQGSGAFPFTPQSWGVSTTTTIGLFNGFISNASSTINANLIINGNSTTTHATSTSFAATTICLTGDTCRTTWPTGGSTGTSTVEIFNYSTTPDTGGNSWFEPYSIQATNDHFQHMVAIASSTTAKTGFYSSVYLPLNYAGTRAGVVLHFSCPVTSGNIVWDVDYRAIGGDDTESLDQATDQENLTATKACGSAVNERQEVYFPLTAGNLAAGDTVEIFVGRDGADANDTGVAGAAIHDVTLQYQ